VNFSTSRATLQVPVGTANGRAQAPPATTQAPSPGATTTPHCTNFRARCRTASKRAIPAATDTFKL
jgi:hypothetical protein